MFFILANLMISPPAFAEPPAPHIAIDFRSAVSRTAPSGMATVYRIAGDEEGAKNAFFGVLEIQPGARVPVHRDATEEYLYIVRGAGKITIDGKTTDIKEDFAIFMPAGAEVTFEATGTETVRAVQFFSGQGPEAKYDSWVGPKE